ncbi:MAG TPA: Pvc16 family protein, partial [Candidatus Dormibacteraeota bacterium]|nr:Pvc16 family protein [Candidatus Dormibacteraeota bacterium]
QWILGDAMRVLNDFAIVPRQTLNLVLTNEFEHVRLTIEPLSLEDLSKIWTALNRPFRLSIAYCVTVVQIETELPRSYPRPVGPLPSAGPRDVAVTGTTPLITYVHASGSTVSNARVGDVLIIEGTELYGDHVRVEFDEVDAGAYVTAVRDQRISVVVPDDFRLQPGPHTVRVVKDVMLGNPPGPRTAFSSNLGVFMLVAQVTSAVQVAGRNAQVDGTRLFATAASCQTVIGDAVVDGAAYATATPTRIVFPIPAALAAGNYPLRVRVNGAESIDGTVLAVA